MVKRKVVGVISTLCLLMPTMAVHDVDRRSGAPPAFDTWRAALVDEAVDRGFERQLVEEAIGTVTPLPLVLELDRVQAVSPPDLQTYLSERVTPELIERGREMMTRHRQILADVERAFGVPANFLVAVWGAETGYGRFTGNVPVFQALATLAWDRRRAPYFRAELFDALSIVRAGQSGPHSMTGSWAGAMGQPQFMPSSYLEYAVDFDGDGTRDIWTSVADTLASIANYLQRFGWQPGIGWGWEAAPDPGIQSWLERDIPTRLRGCGAIRALTERRPLADWSRYISGAENAGLARDHLEASLLVLDGRTFVVSRNYEAILGYNCSHRYALSVSMLADRLTNPERHAAPGVDRRWRHDVP